MPTFPIKLGSTQDTPFPTPLAGVNNKEYYPNLHIDRIEGLELPEEGTITLRYKTCRDTTEIREDDRTKSYDLDILEVVSAKASRVESDKEDPADALDKLREETEGEYEE